MAKQSCREPILDAAEEVVIECGGAHLTLDAVAEKAGVSKGGLLYHFPSKEALLMAMLDRLCDRFEVRRDKTVQTMPESPSRLLQAHIQEFFFKEEREAKIGCSMLAAIANDPRLMDNVRTHVKEKVRAMLGDFQEFTPAALVYLAVEGIKLLELFAINPFTPDEGKGIRDELLRRAAELK